MKNRVFLALCLASLLPFAGCDELPTGASSSSLNWSPYIVVHTFAGGRTQMPYMEQMIGAGALRGVRIDAHPPDSQDFSRWAVSRGLEVIAIFPNELVAQPDAADLFIQYVQMHPNVRHWEVGNEIDLFIQMSMEEYTPIFLEIYDKAKRRFPDIEIIPQAPVGAADGAQQVGRMLDFGVENLLYSPDPNYRLNVMALHAYSVASSYLYQGKNQIERIPAHTQIWVTETGVQNWNLHVQHVRTVYPRIRNLLRASRIYWYVLSGHGRFGLIGGLDEDAPATFSPLFDELTGGVK